MSTRGYPRPVQLDHKTKSIVDRAIAREQSLSRLLMTYIVAGIIFMLLPGTFLGVWNLIKISSREAAESISPAWIQAHGHAQLFGWVGTFILGIGFYSIPKLRKLKPKKYAGRKKVFKRPRVTPRMLRARATSNNEFRSDRNSLPERLSRLNQFEQNTLSLAAGMVLGLRREGTGEACSQFWRVASESHST